MEKEELKEGNQQDWRALFQKEKTLGKLQYFPRVKMNGRMIVKPPLEAMEEGIAKWSPSLIGQFLDKHPPFFYEKGRGASMGR